MSVAAYVLNLIQSCPALSQAPDGIWHDALGAEPGQYGLIDQPGEPVIKRYLNGDSMRRHVFAIQANQPTETDAQRLANSAIYESIALWMERQSRSRLLPAMESGQRPMGLRASGQAYLDRDPGAGMPGPVYTMTCEFTYFQKAGNDNYETE